VSTRVTTLCAAVLFALALTASPAGAHTALRTSTPAAGATLRETPAPAQLVFESAIDPRTLSVRVLDDTGAAVATAVERLTPDRPDTAVIDLTLPALRQGTYALA
jgi:copper transport protein